MKALKKWVLILALAGPTVTSFSCSSTLWRDLRDAAVDGAASFVEQLTFDLLDQAIAPGGV